jgi:membrane protein YqaA with SNARE-associated domain
MSRIVSWLEALASSLGAPGLFVVAFLDSSFLSLPEFNDVLLILMVTQNEAQMPYYAAMATLGSISGCLVLYGLGRKSGEAILRKRFSGSRVERALALCQRFGALAIIVPSLLPPPAPFKVFVLLSGVAKVPVMAFSAAVAVGRGVRYFGEGALAVRYGDQAIEMLRANGFLVSLGLAVLVLGSGGVYALVRRHHHAGAVDKSAADV